ncbi:hypothetical protein ACWEQL_14485, partial [Kitasatospora sp. NPDC004240]
MAERRRGRTAGPPSDGYGAAGSAGGTASAEARGAVARGAVAPGVAELTSVLKSAQGQAVVVT